MKKVLVWTFVWLVYATAILYVAFETEFQIHSKEVTGLIALLWIVCPVVTYYVVREREEAKRQSEEEQGRGAT